MLAGALSANLIHASAHKPGAHVASNADATLAQLIVLSSAGQQYPSKFLNYSADEASLTGLENQITPLGQRQHFLVGSELRSRYVDEA